MYRTYEEPGKDEEYVIQLWDGDCFSYSVFETKEEYDAEMERLRKIDEEYKAKKKEYLENCKSW